MRSQTQPLSLALISFSVLLFEILLTRLFSVVLLYHFAYVAVSLALLGFSLGALLVHYLPGLHAPRRVPGTVALCGTLYGLTVTGALLLLLHHQPEGVDLYAGLNLPTFRYLALSYGAATVPFVLAGVCVSVLLAAGRERIGTFYAYDLLGAAAGALAVLPALDLLGAPQGMLAAGLVGCVGAWLGAPRGRWALAPALGCALLLALGGAARDGDLLTLRYSKGKVEDKVLAERWNSFSRVTALPGRNGVRLLIDSGAATKIWESAHHDELLKEISTPALRLRPGGDVLLIGPGGGKDVAASVLLGMGSVTGVELNPIVVEMTTQTWRDLAGGLYDRDEVQILVDEGRSFLSRAERTWDVLMLTNIDTWAASSAGAFTLAENHLYTVEAFRTYLEHLDDDGLLAITRWYFPGRPHETLRIVGLALTALAERGAAEPWRHVVVLQEGSERPHGNVLIRANPFEEHELEQLRQLVAANPPWTLVYLPGEEHDPVFSELALAADREAFFEAYPFDVSPPTDDRPFFFYVVRAGNLLSSFQEDFYRLPNVTNIGVFLLVGSFVLDALFVLLLVAIPWLLRRRGAAQERTGLAPVLLYFGCLGAGFMIVELALMQHFILFLGHPALALTVVLFVILLSSGLGSLYSGSRSLPVARRRLPLWIGAAVLVVVASALALPAVFEAAMSWPRAARIALSAACLFPVGFLLGTCFPTGVRLLGHRAEALLPWVWAINGGTSVMGSALAMLLAMNHGFAATLLAGLGLYVLAALLVPRLAAVGERAGA